MKQGWNQIAFRELLEWRGPDTPVIPSEAYSFAGVYSHGRGVFKKHTIAGTDFSYDRLTQLRENDFIYPKLMAWEGALGVVPSECHGCFVSPEFQVFTVNRSIVLPGFLSFLLRRPSLWRELGRLSPGTNLRRRRLQPAELLGHCVAVPSLSEQHRILTHLTAIESRVERARTLREEQEAQLRGLLSSSFHLLEGNVEWLPMAEVAPLAWRQIEIQPEEVYTEFGVRSFYKGVFFRRKVAGSELTWQDMFQLKAGDIVFSNIMAWEKAIALAQPEQDGWAGNHRMLVCEPRLERVLPNYLLHYFMTEEGFAKVLQVSPGTAARNKTLKADRLMEIQVPVPPLARQTEFERLCNHVAAVRAAQVPVSAQMDVLQRSALERTFGT